MDHGRPDFPGPLLDQQAEPCEQRQHPAHPDDIRGEAPDRAISAISKQFEVSRSKAGRLVMTESAYFSSAAQKDCFNALGVEKYRDCGLF